MNFLLKPIPYEEYLNVCVNKLLHTHSVKQHASALFPVVSRDANICLVSKIFSSRSFADTPLKSNATLDFDSLSGLLSLVKCMRYLEKSGRLYIIVCELLLIKLMDE